MLYVFILGLFYFNYEAQSVCKAKNCSACINIHNVRGNEPKCGWCSDNNTCYEIGQEKKCKFWNVGNCSRQCNFYGNNCNECLADVESKCGFCSGIPFNETKTSLPFNSINWNAMGGERESICVPFNYKYQDKCAVFHVPNKTPCANCSAQKSCKACLTRFARIRNCGWCPVEKICVEGDSNGPYDNITCPQYQRNVGQCALPSKSPTQAPTPSPTRAPSAAPTVHPTHAPSEHPTAHPTAEPTPHPTAQPTEEPTPRPTAEPTSEPTPAPTNEPTPHPTGQPTTPAPTGEPTNQPTTQPSHAPTTAAPTHEPSHGPTHAPVHTPAPTPEPTMVGPFVPIRPVPGKSKISAETADILIGVGLGVVLIITAAILWSICVYSKQVTIRQRAIG